MSRFDIGERLAVLAFDRDNPLRLQARGAVDDGHLVLLEKIGDARRELPRHLAGTAHDLGEVECDAIGLEPKLAGMVEEGQHLRRTEQRFSGYAAPVQANAAKVFALDHYRFQAELRGADGRHVPAWAAPDHCNVECFRHCRPQNDRIPRDLVGVSGGFRNFPGVGDLVVPSKPHAACWQALHRNGFAGQRHEFDLITLPALMDIHYRANIARFQIMSRQILDKHNQI